MTAKLINHCLELVICLSHEATTSVSRGPLLDDFRSSDLMGILGLLYTILLNPANARASVTPTTQEICVFCLKVRNKKKRERRFDQCSG